MLQSPQVDSWGSTSNINRREGRITAHSEIEGSCKKRTPGLRPRHRPTGVEVGDAVRTATTPPVHGRQGCVGDAVLLASSHPPVVTTLQHHQHLHTSTTPPKRPELDRTQPGLAGVDEGEQPEAPETVAAGGNHANPQLGIAPGVQAGAWRGWRRWGFCGGGQGRAEKTGAGRSSGDGGRTGRWPTRDSGSRMTARDQEDQINQGEVVDHGVATKSPNSPVPKRTGSSRGRAATQHHRQELERMRVRTRRQEDGRERWGSVASRVRSTRPNPTRLGRTWLTRPWAKPLGQLVQYFFFISFPIRFYHLKIK
jgi:hypothetical protein